MMKSPADSDGENFDEHAHEDGYFAAKEHELLTDMRLEFHKAQAARRDAAQATCPKCAGRFHQHAVLGFTLERCDNCQGIWLNKGELDALLRQQRRGPLALFLDRCFAKTETGINN